MDLNSKMNKMTSET